MYVCMYVLSAPKKKGHALLGYTKIDLSDTYVVGNFLIMMITIIDIIQAIITIIIISERTLAWLERTFGFPKDGRIETRALLMSVSAL